MMFKSFFVDVVLAVTAILVAVFCLLLLVVCLVSEIPGLRYTVKHGESIHRGATIFLHQGNVIEIRDADGRTFFYCDGWEVAQELPSE